MLGGVLIDHIVSNSKYWSWLGMSVKVTYKMKGFFEIFWTMFEGVLIDHIVYNSKHWSWLGMSVKVTYKMKGFSEIFWTVLGGVLIDHIASMPSHVPAWLGDVCCKITYKMIGFF